MTPARWFVGVLGFGAAAMVCIGVDNFVLAGVHTTLSIVCLIFLVASGDQPPT